MIRKIPVALTIAGSDSGGGAGIQADLRTFSSLGVFGCSAITAVTSQNPCEVRRIDALPAAAVGTQIEAVLAEFDVKGVKTGMLFNSKIIRAVASLLGKKRNIFLVVDPVMVSTSGAVLLEKNAVNDMEKLMFPIACLVTPNIHEAELLLKRKIRTFEEMLRASADISTRWGCGALVKGGHVKFKGGIKADAVAYDGRLYKLTSPEIRTRAGHGTGCTFSAAIAAEKAKGRSLENALVSAKAFVYGSLLESVKPGRRIHAMYPPSGNYKSKIRLEQCGKY
ncbi:MAG TPA: bifunctional hydroxymethylpyrimidine kinase/phosphomethylpyrimidine kinase [Lentisphaeria bacterium]|nr:MAG: bifunctional hydroxymethylpyrimidine kinase/phosphomethylpyrimidine kinase [Lentisphaerae bacterium GWF2_49_21]HBC87836.1 bifunctional hydroxymethylpyrimidine kinase/phosphomethylpyrimidine kinase [Lentisphaeria bacterium]